MNARILFFEGPTGGGKSTLSQFVAQQLRAAGAPVYWIEEHTLDDTVFAAFREALQSSPPNALPALFDGWRQLITRLASPADVLCLDGAFFNSTLKLLFAYDVGQAETASYLSRLYDLLAPFTPALIRATGDVARIVRMTIAERGGAWATNVAAAVAQYPRQRRLGMDGIEGFVSFFVDSQAELETVATSYPFATYRLDTVARDWDRYQRDLGAWLDIPLTATPSAPARDLAGYAGTYQPPAYFPAQFNHPLQVEVTPGGLRLHMVFMRNFRLIDRGTDTFDILGRPVQLAFVRDDEGRVHGAIYPFVPDQRFFCEKVD